MNKNFSFGHQTFISTHTRITRSCHESSESNPCSHAIYPSVLLRIVSIYAHVFEVLLSTCLFEILYTFVFLFSTYCVFVLHKNV